MVSELVYADPSVSKAIKAKWPHAVFEDASDDIHEDRFEVAIQDVTEDDFYVFAIREGFALVCLKFQLMLRSREKDQHTKIREWLKKSKE
jgi:hypothetical protein